MAGYGYDLYGLRVRSQVPLTFQRTSNGLKQPPWDRITLALSKGPLLGQIPHSMLPSLCAGNSFQWIPLQDGSEYLRWRGLFEFLIAADGRRVDCFPLNPTYAEAFQFYLFNQVLSFILIKLGIEPLHATAVVIDGQAIGFVGDSGYGKSSLAAAFLQAGFPLLTDDLLVLREDASDLLAYPGIPRIKLFPRVARTLLGDSIRHSAPYPHSTKRILPLKKRQFLCAPVPLRALYLLPSPDAPRPRQVRITTLTAQEGCLALIPNSINVVVGSRARRKRQFLSATRVARRIPIKAIAHPREFNQLAALRSAILKDLSP